jgi:hypothetical protein
VIRIARNISRNLSRNLSRTVGTEPDLVLDSYSGASAAYSLYDLGNKRGTVVETEATYHNPAVRLRRDSDNTHKSFPGGAFTQMLNWANEDVAVCNDNLNNGGFETAGGGGADVFADWLENTSGSSTLTRDTSVFETGTASCRFNLDGSGSLVGISNNGFGIIEVGSTVEYSFRAKASSGSPSVAVGTALSTETVHALTTEWATYSGSFVVSARGNVSIKRNSTTANAEYWIDSYDVKITQANAYAATWYDQSGSDNDAIQSTASSQPKVVDAGSLVTDANGNYALDFDGTDDYFDVATISEAQPITGFVVVDMENPTGESSHDILDGTAADTNRILLDQNASTWRLFAGAALLGPTFTNDVDLLYFLANGASSAIGLDGATPTTGNAGTNSGWASGLTIGTSISGGFMYGSLATIIIYPSDQSANRSGIESVLSNTIQTALS